MKRIASTIFILLILGSSSLPVFAQTPQPTAPVECVDTPGSGKYCLLEPLPCIEGTGNDCSGNTLINEIDINQYISYVYKLALALGVFLAVVMITWGGFEWMLSAVPFVKLNAKARINNAIFGLLMLLSSYLILQTIDPRLVQVNTTIPPLQVMDSVDLTSLLNEHQAALRQMSSERLSDVIEAENELKELDRELADIKAKFDRQEIPEADYRMQSGLLEERRAVVYAQQAANIAEGSGIVLFQQAHGEINSSRTALQEASYGLPSLQRYTDTSVENRLAGGRYPINTPNIIQSTYNKKINTILALNPKTEEVLDYSRKLIKQRDFFIAQVKQEEKLGINLAKFRGGNTCATCPGRVFLDDVLRETTRDINDASKMQNSGLKESEYKKIMQKRIDVINSVFGTRN